MTEDFMIPLVAAVAGVVAGFAGLAAYYAATSQNRLTATNVAADWMRDLRGWASEAVDVLSESSYVCHGDDFVNLDTNWNAEINRCQSRLSALIDRGRFLLPNEFDESYGSHNSSAYRGIRHAALDPLIAAHRILMGKANLCNFPNRTAAINGVQREFVSSIQEILDPRSSNNAVAAIIRNSHSNRKKDRSLGGLLPDPNNIPKGAQGVLYTASLRYSKNKN